MRRGSKSANDLGIGVAQTNNASMSDAVNYVLKSGRVILKQYVKRNTKDICEGLQKLILKQHAECGVRNIFQPLKQHISASFAAACFSLTNGG
jgi:hypothetical protein